MLNIHNNPLLNTHRPYSRCGRYRNKLRNNTSLLLRNDRLLDVSRAPHQVICKTLLLSLGQGRFQFPDYNFTNQQFSEQHFIISHMLRSPGATRGNTRGVRREPFRGRNSSAVCQPNFEDTVIRENCPVESSGGGDRSLCRETRWPKDHPLRLDRTVRSD